MRGPHTTYSGIVTPLERSSIKPDVDERGRLYAIWSRAVKRLLLTVSDPRQEDERQIELRPEHVEALGQFLIETNPGTSDDAWPTTYRS
jgi:hypothetical protein